MASVYGWPEDNLEGEFADNVRRRGLSAADLAVEDEVRNRPASPPTVQRTAGDHVQRLLEGLRLAKPGAERGVLTPLARRAAIGLPVLVGVGTVLDQLNREGTPLQNLVGAGTALAGNAAGAAVGGFVGGFGGPLAPITVPLGTAVGSMIGGEVLSSLGRTLAGATALTPEERARQQLIKDAEANARAKVAQAEILAPTQQMLAQKALENEIKRTAALDQLAFQRNRWDAMSRAINDQTVASNNANQSAINAIYSGGIM